MKRMGILSAAGILFVSALLAGCSAKHITAGTAESYYEYEDFMKSAGYTKRTTVYYLDKTDSFYMSPEEMKEAVEPAQTTGVLACDWSAKTCEVYNLNGTDETKVGAVVYGYLYDNDGFRLSKSGNDRFVEYTYEDGKISAIRTYEGTAKTADSTMIEERAFSYGEDGNCSRITVTTYKEGASTVNYVPAFDESGKLIRLDLVEVKDETETITSSIRLTYNEKGLPATYEVYVLSEKGEGLLTYYEYTYE